MTYKYGGSTFYAHKSVSVDPFLSATRTAFCDPNSKKITPFLLDVKNTGYLKNPLTNDLKTYHHGVQDYPQERFKSEYDVNFNKKVIDYFR